MGAEADRIANLLLPQLSVLTRRARYFSFFCWAVRESDGDFAKLHRLEATLAVEEAKRHADGDNEETCPGVVGRSRAKRYLETHQGKSPARPERLSKNTAFALYRPTLRSLGLLSHVRRPTLTEEGGRLASLFARARGRRHCCLSEMSSGEKSVIKRLLGLDGRQGDNLAESPARRRDTKNEVGAKLRFGNSTSVLDHFGRLQVHRSEVSRQLHRAYVWELLSCGLMLAFTRLHLQKSLAKTATELRRALGTIARTPPLQSFPANANKWAVQLVALLRRR